MTKRKKSKYPNYGSYEPVVPSSDICLNGSTVAENLNYLRKKISHVPIRTFWGCDVLAYYRELRESVVVLKDCANCFITVYSDLIFYFTSFDDAMDCFFYLIIRDLSEYRPTLLEVARACAECSYFTRKDRFSYDICDSCSRCYVCKTL